MIHKKIMMISCLLMLFPLTPISGAQTQAAPPVTQAPPTNQQKLATLQGAGNANLSKADKKALKEKSQARGVQKVGGKIVAGTNAISGYLASSNFVTNLISLGTSLSPIAIPDPLAAVGLLVNIVGIVGEGLEAYGSYALRKGAIAEAFSTAIDVNDLNAATESLEKIKALQQIEDNITGQKTVNLAVEKAQKKGKVSKAKMLLIHVNPSHLTNTMKKYTDQYHITTYGPEAQTKLAKIKEDRQKEQEIFDAITVKLEKRFLNRLILPLKGAIHKAEQFQTDPKAYQAHVAELQRMLDVAKANAAATQQEIDQHKPQKTVGLTLGKDKDLKKLRVKHLNQEIMVNKAHGDLEFFVGVHKNLPGAKAEVNKLEDEMHNLTPKPADHTVHGETKHLQDEIDHLKTRLKSLEAKVGTCCGAAPAQPQPANNPSRSQAQPNANHK